MSENSMIFTTLLCIISSLLCVTESFKSEVLPVSYANNTHETYTNPFISRSDKVCRFRNFPILYPINLWHYLVGGYCYFYTIPSRRNSNWLQVNTSVVIPIVHLENGTAVYIDHTNQRFVEEIIEPTFKIKLYVEQWLECVENGIECCERFDDEDYNIYPTDDFPCPSLWDGWACWGSAKANTTLSQECPIYSFTSGERICELNSYRECFANGTWKTSTDNTGCAVAPIYRRRHSYHLVALYISIGLTTPAIIIYLSFSKLREAKDWETFNLSLYRNLLISVVVKNIFIIISKEVVLFDSLVIEDSDSTVTIMEKNGVWCRILTFFENVSKNVVFTCMLIIAFYLHKSIARFFASGTIHNIHILYLGVIVSIIPSVIWAIVMATFSDDHCWMVDSNGYQWITDGYRFFILGVNLLLLLDIIRVLTTGRVRTDSKTLKSAAKATLFLIPLFGVPLLLTGQRSLFDSDSCSDVYYFITYTIEGSQGVVVALLFCYLNKKVHNEMKKSYKHFAINVEQRFNIKLWTPVDDSRRTGSTNVRFSSSATQRQQNRWESFS